MEKIFSKSELANFESWRGLLATIVVIAHICQIFYYPIYSNTIFFAIVGGIANIAVIVFFILSGILISLSIKNLTTYHHFNWKQYLVNRFFRIYPGLMIILTICVVLWYFLPYINGGGYKIFHVHGEKNLVRTDYKITWAQAIRTILMLQPGIININGPLWSLFIEWWIYISAMLLTIGIKASNNIHRLTCFVGFVFSILLCVYGYGVYALFFVAIWYSGFLYTIYANKILLRKAYLAISGTLIIIIIVLGGGSVFDINTANRTYFGILQFAVGLLSFSLITKITPFTIFKSIAKYSYTLYILHFPLLLFIFFITRKYIYDKDYLILGISGLSFIFVLIVSKIVSKYAEYKYSLHIKQKMVN